MHRFCDFPMRKNVQKLVQGHYTHSGDQKRKISQVSTTPYSWLNATSTASAFEGRMRDMQGKYYQPGFEPGYKDFESFALAAKLLVTVTNHLEVTLLYGSIRQFYNSTFIISATRFSPLSRDASMSNMRSLHPAISVTSLRGISIGIWP